MTVRELIEQLEKMPQDATVGLDMESYCAVYFDDVVIDRAEDNEDGTVSLGYFLFEC